MTGQFYSTCLPLCKGGHKISAYWNVIIREAIHEWIEHRKQKQWPEIILKFKDKADFPALETYRNELQTPKKDPLA